MIYRLLRAGLLSALAVACSAGIASAQGVTFSEGSFDEALAQAAQEDKLVFVDAYAVWCGPCRRMSSDVFPREDVGAFFDEHFVSLKIDMEKGPGRAFGKRFPVSSYPTLLFIDADGELVQRVVGAQAPEQLIKQAQLALRKSGAAEDYAAKYQQGDRSPKLVATYVKTLNRAGKPSLAVANEFLRADGLDFADEDVLAVVYNACVQADSRVFSLLIEHRAALNKLYGAKTVDARIEDAADRTLQNGLTYRSEALVAEAKAAVAEHLPRRGKAFEAAADLAVAKRSRDAGLAYKAAKKLISANGNRAADNHEMAIELAATFPDQPKTLALASKMAGTAAKQAPSFEHLFTYARLLNLTGRTKPARKQAEAAQAKLLGGADPRHAAMIEELLREIQG